MIMKSMMRKCRKMCSSAIISCMMLTCTLANAAETLSNVDIGNLKPIGFNADFIKIIAYNIICKSITDYEPAKVS